MWPPRRDFAGAVGGLILRDDGILPFRGRPQSSIRLRWKLSGVRSWFFPAIRLTG